MVKVGRVTLLYFLSHGSRIFVFFKSFLVQYTSLFTYTKWKTVTLFKTFCVQHKTVMQVWSNMRVSIRFLLSINIFRTKISDCVCFSPLPALYAPEEMQVPGFH